MKRPPLAVTLGDPAGIGPELTLRAWAALKDRRHDFIAYADLDQLSEIAERFNLPAPRACEPEAAGEIFAQALPVRPVPLPEQARPGHPAPANAAAVVASIEACVRDTLAGRTGGVVTNPISKAVLYEQGFRFPGHTEFVAHLTAHAAWDGPRGPVMMLAAPELKTVLVTIHLGLRDALDALSTEAILHTARVTLAALRTDFGLGSPRLAIAGLNPHAGEGGALGREEIEMVAPAVETLRAEGHDVAGPMPPDTMFHAEARARYDAAVCLYHDQGLIPVKTLNFHGGVNTTLGLPIIRTSPDHGTAFDIAGRGLARADSLIAAIRLASTMAENRQSAFT